MLSDFMDDNSAADIGLRGTSDPANYAFSGKVMLSTVLILSIVCILVAFFHIYSRWFLLRRSTTHNHRIPTTTRVTIQKQGLDPAVLKSLPIFTYSATTTATASLDCAICISEFEESETVRILPNCNHSFHLECIDMWFHSHTNCPLCRSPVQLPISAQSPTDGVTVETGEILAVIVEVTVTETAAERGMNVVTESEGGNSGFKLMAGPVRSLRRVF